MPLSDDALADREAETFSRSNALRGEEGFKDVRKILWGDSGAVVDNFHNRLIVVASGLDRDFTTAIYSIRRVVEQVDPHLCELARKAPDMTAFARKTLSDAYVLELVIKDAKRAPDLLM